MKHRTIKTKEPFALYIIHVGEDDSDDSRRKKKKTRRHKLVSIVIVVSFLFRVFFSSFETATWLAHVEKKFLVQGNIKLEPESTDLKVQSCH